MGFCDCGWSGLVFYRVRFGNSFIVVLLESIDF